MQDISPGQMVKLKDHGSDEFEVINVTQMHVGLAPVGWVHPDQEKDKPRICKFAAHKDMIQP